MKSKSTPYRGLTQEKLKELLNYNTKTGIFTWKVSRKNWVKVNQVAGCKNNTGYIQIYVCCKPYKAHRLAWLYMTGRWPKTGIDHINCIKNDNRWKNLREATKSQNMQNSKKQLNCTSGYKGVDFYKNYNKWRARIKINGKETLLGYYDDIKEAKKAYNDTAKKHFKEFYKA